MRGGSPPGPSSRRPTAPAPCGTPCAGTAAPHARAAARAVGRRGGREGAGGNGGGRGGGGARDGGRHGGGPGAAAGGAGRGDLTDEGGGACGDGGGHGGAGHAAQGRVRLAERAVALRARAACEAAGGKTPARRAQGNTAAGRGPRAATPGHGMARVIQAPPAQRFRQPSPWRFSPPRRPACLQPVRPVLGPGSRPWLVGFLRH